MLNKFYSSITDRIFKRIDYVNNNLFILSELFHFVKKNGSFLEVVANNKFEEFSKITNFYSCGRAAREDYDFYLFHFSEIQKIKSYTSKPYNGPDKEEFNKINEILSYEPSYLKEVPIFFYPNDENLIFNTIKEALKYDLVILRGFLDKFGINNKFFTTEYLRANFPHTRVEVVEQLPNFKGFANADNKRTIWTLQEYIGYLTNRKNEKLFDYLKRDNFSMSGGESTCCPNNKESNNTLNNNLTSNNNNEQSDLFKMKQNPNNNKKITTQQQKVGSIQFSNKSAFPHISKDKIYYGVNIDMDDMIQPREELEKKIHPLLVPCSFYDALSYVREPIRGMTIPQFYLKEDGVWTGGHEENNRIRSININHGNNCEMADSEWYGVTYKESDLFTSNIKRMYNINPLETEGLWFEDWTFFMKNKINFLYTLQKAGDIVLVGPGCLHWVRSKGFSVHSSWNFCPKELNQFTCGISRRDLNRKFNMRSLVPMFTLFLDMMNFELYNIDHELMLEGYTFLKRDIKRSCEELKDIKNNKFYKDIPISLEPTNSKAIICEVCLEEIINAWALCYGCPSPEDGSIFDNVLCLHCFRNHYTQCLNKNIDIVIYYRYEDDALEYFLKRCERKLSTQKEEGDEKVQYELIKKTYETELIFQKKAQWMKLNLDLTEPTLRMIQQNFEGVSTYIPKQSHFSGFNANNTNLDLYGLFTLNQIVNTKDMKKILKEMKIEKKTLFKQSQGIIPKDQQSLQPQVIIKKNFSTSPSKNNNHSQIQTINQGIKLDFVGKKKKPETPQNDLFYDFEFGKTRESTKRKTGKIENTDELKLEKLEFSDSPPHNRVREHTIGEMMWGPKMKKKNKGFPFILNVEHDEIILPKEVI
jgi:hypothetical protein